MTRPLLSSVPQDRTVWLWREQDPTNPARLIERCTRICRWACGNCDAEGRMWEGEPPTRCPECGAEWTGDLAGHFVGPDEAK